MTLAQRKVTSKLSSFLHQAERYNQILELNGSPLMTIPDSAEIKQLALSDAFWNVGELDHPNEAWAADQATKDGIQAYLRKTRASEELRRLARECRQLMNSAVVSDSKLATLWESVRPESSKPSLIFHSNQWCLTDLSLVESIQVLTLIVKQISGS